MLGGERLAKYWMPWLVGMPTETTIAIASLMFGGVFERLPRLRIAFAHGGGSFPGTFGRLAHGFEARPDLCAVANPRHPREYLGRFWCDALTHDSRALRLLIDLIGVERVALGTDYPFPLGEARAGDADRVARASTPPRQDRLLAQNGFEWLGLPRNRFL